MRFAVMAGAAVLAFPYFCFRDFRGVRLNGKVELEMADPAGIIPPVDPVRKGHRRMSAAGRHPVDQDIAVLRGRGELGERKDLVELVPFCPACSLTQEESAGRQRS